jgi:hypothetical protein
VAPITQPTNLTNQEAIARLALIVGGRFTSTLAQSPVINWNVQGIITALQQQAGVAAPGRLGSCHYLVQGQSFCVEGVTEAECLMLGGVFTPNGHCT